MKIIPIIFVADDFYLPYTSVVIQSIIENSSLENYYKIHIVHCDALGYHQISLLKEQIEKYPQFNINFIDASTYMSKYNFMPKRIWSKNIWCKLLIPYLFEKYEKIVYLDSDVICRCDIAEIFDIDMKEKILCAARCPINISIYSYTLKESKDNLPKNIAESIDFYCMNNLKNYQNYFCSGVMIFDVNKFCDFIPKERLLDFAVQKQNEPIFSDQSVFNIIFEGSINFLHQKYGYEVENHWIKPQYLPKQVYDEYFEAKENPQIIHFLWKPWTRFYHVEYFYEFWKYATRTKFCDIIVQRMNERKLIGYDYYHGGGEHAIYNPTKEFQEISLLQNDGLEYLKKSDLPLVLYGAAQLAVAVKCFLDRNGIKIDFVAVDKEYLLPNMKFYDFDVLAAEDIFARDLEINVIVTFSSGKYIEKQDELSKLQNVRKCLFFDVFQSIDFVFDSNFVNRYSDVLTELYNNLADDLSRRTMLEFMKTKNLTNAKELIKLNVENEPQYFPDFIQLSDNETFVDCGAFTLDTVGIFLKKTNYKFNKIFAFEPDADNINKCKKTLEKFGCVNVFLIEKGTWSEKKRLYFNNRSDSGSNISENGDSVIDVDSVDNVCGKENVSFIKMDIEGAELEALHGAENTIRRYKPKLAICVYHKQEDLINIPQYILSIRDDYKLYLRHYGAFVTELVLYAV
jgi:FkbM family methyltransferase